MKYNVSYQNKSTHYIDIELEVECRLAKKLRFQLPAWRPGRYELGNFAKNVQRWKAFNEKSTELKYRKLSKDLWEVDCEGANEVIIRYNYFANELNAGSTFLSDDQLYVNPVNCLLYEVGRLEEECSLKVDVPNDYKIAIALPEGEKNTFLAKNFDELADSPFIASATLKHHSFEVEDTLFHLWFQGECKPDWELLEKDFTKYTQEQIKLFGEFPTKEYHYLFQILPHSAYHGVEHSASTVIALGPSYHIFKWSGRYEDLLGVSSHELFHTWNVKRIRPIEMVPYDFAKENYSRLGYLAEGATTWYGDLMLYRSEVFDDKTFFKTFNQLLDRHYNNPGVLNLSVADSSFDTWLDGYVAGVPNRKASIYTEGALITFMLDVEIRKATNNEKSFDDVLRTLYADYYKNGKGVAEADYKAEVEKLTGKNMNSFFEDFVWGSKDYTDQLNGSLNYMGLKMEKKPSSHYHEAYLGVRIIEDQIAAIYPGSPAEESGISVQDKLIAINRMKINNDQSEWLEYFKKDEIQLLLQTPQSTTKQVNLKLSNKFYYSSNTISWQEELNEEQQKAKESWLMRNE